MDPKKKAEKAEQLKLQVQELLARAATAKEQRSQYEKINRDCQREADKLNAQIVELLTGGK